MQPWWLAFPGRVEYEYACLDAAGVAYVVDDEAADRGVLQLRISRIKDVEVDLDATFPDLFPFFRPAVRMADPDNAFAHHRHPFSGDLCLLGRDSSQWGSGDTLAWLLTEQLPKTIHLGTLTVDAADVTDLSGEDAQAEPFSEYYTKFADKATILVDGGWSLSPDADNGELDVGFNTFTPDVEGGTLGAVLSVRREDGSALAALEGVQPARFPHRVAARWVKVDQPIHEDTPEAIWAALHTMRPQAPESPWQPVPGSQMHGWRVQITGLVFPEEQSHRELGNGWMFIVRVRRPGPAAQPKASKGKKQAPAGPTTTTALVRAGYAGRTDMTGRMPELNGLASKHVLLIGLGALGSPVAEHLARAGVGQLTVVDRDRIEPGNLVRHAAEIRHVGWQKVEGVADVAFGAGLYCEVMFQSASIGGTRGKPPPPGVEDHPQQDWLAKKVDQADLVLDCTAEKGVQQALAWLCDLRSTPLITASATNGGWGGRVSAFVPHSQQGCWSCLELHLADGSIPAAPAKPDEEGVQPVGCAEPTFTGTGFDLTEVALHAVRTAAGLLQEDTADGYPRLAKPVHLLALRDTDGHAIAPAWTAHDLPIHPSCTAPHGPP